MASPEFVWLGQLHQKADPNLTGWSIPNIEAVSDSTALASDPRNRYFVAVYETLAALHDELANNTRNPYTRLEASDIDGDSEFHDQLRQMLAESQSGGHDADITPHQVRTAALQLGVDLKTETPIVPLVRALLCLPLPDEWRIEVDGEEEATYISPGGEMGSKHPCVDEFRAVVQLARKQLAGERKISGGNSSEEKDVWLEFTDPADPSESFLFNFTTGMRRYSEKHEAAVRIQALARGHLVRQASSSQAPRPRGAKKSVSLSRATSGDRKRSAARAKPSKTPAPTPAPVVRGLGEDAKREQKPKRVIDSTPETADGGVDGNGSDGEDAQVVFAPERGDIEEDGGDGLSDTPPPQQKKQSKNLSVSITSRKKQEGFKATSKPSPSNKSQFGRSPSPVVSVDDLKKQGRRSFAAKMKSQNGVSVDINALYEGEKEVPLQKRMNAPSPSPSPSPAIVSDSPTVESTGSVGARSSPQGSNRHVTRLAGGGVTPASRSAKKGALGGKTIQAAMSPSSPTVPPSPYMANQTATFKQHSKATKGKRQLPDKLLTGPEDEIITITREELLDVVNGHLAVKSEEVAMLKERNYAALVRQEELVEDKQMLQEEMEMKEALIRRLQEVNIELRRRLDISEDGRKTAESRSRNHSSSARLPSRESFGSPPTGWEATSNEFEAIRPASRASRFSALSASAGADENETKEERRQRMALEKRKKLAHDNAVNIKLKKEITGLKRSKKAILVKVTHQEHTIKGLQKSVKTKDRQLKEMADSVMAFAQMRANEKEKTKALKLELKKTADEFKVKKANLDKELQDAKVEFKKKLMNQEETSLKEKMALKVQNSMLFDKAMTEERSRIAADRFKEEAESKLLGLKETNQVLQKQAKAQRAFAVKALKSSVKEREKVNFLGAKVYSAAVSQLHEEHANSTEWKRRLEQKDLELAELRKQVLQMRKLEEKRERMRSKEMRKGNIRSEANEGHARGRKTRKGSSQKKRNTQTEVADNEITDIYESAMRDEQWSPENEAMLQGQIGGELGSDWNINESDGEHDNNSDSDGGEEDPFDTLGDGAHWGHSSSEEEEDEVAKRYQEAAEHVLRKREDEEEMMRREEEALQEEEGVSESELVLDHPMSDGGSDAM